MLTPEEQKTLEAYKTLGQIRNKTHANPDFWRSEFERFFAFYKESKFLKLLEENGFEVLEHNKDTREYNSPKNLTVWLLYFVKVK